MTASKSVIVALCQHVPISHSVAWACIMLRHAASITLKNQAPLHYAAWQGHVQVAEAGLGNEGLVRFFVFFLGTLSHELIQGHRQFGSSAFAPEALLDGQARPWPQALARILELRLTWSRECSVGTLPCTRLGALPHR